MKLRSFRTLLFALVVLSMSAAAFAQIGISVSFGPPALPVYEQPLCPGDGYLWTPGYWGWGADFNDYYWIPGTWVMAPEVGFLWTPPYWGWGGNGFAFYDGYWGPQIGFYGGINYGFGYFGNGFEGGRWDGGHFFYNRSVTNINVTNIHNVYNTTVVNRNDSHVSFNGGTGGINVRPTPEQEAAAHDRHIPPVAAQTEHMNQARNDVQQRASNNQGKPPVAATMKPADFKGEGVVRTKEAGGTYERPANAGAARPENGAAARTDNNAAAAKAPAHVKDLPAAERPAAPNTGDPKLDKKYQQQQDKQFQKQSQERQKMQQQQEKEDQQAAKQANQQRQQQVEQRHQQQTQELQQRHQQQQQQLQQRMPAPRPQAAPREEPRPR